MARQSFAALPWLSRAPSPLPVSQGGQEELRCCQCCHFPANSRLFSHLSPAPHTPSPCASATSRSLPLPTLPATHLEHTRGSCGQCWTKRCPAKPYSSHAFPPLSSSIRTCHRRGERAYREVDVSQVVLQRGFPQTCHAPARKVAVARAGDSWDHPWACCWSRTKPLGTAPPSLLHSQKLPVVAESLLL